MKENTNRITEPKTGLTAEENRRRYDLLCEFAAESQLDESLEAAIENLGRWDGPAAEEQRKQLQEMEAKHADKVNRLMSELCALLDIDEDAI